MKRASEIQWDQTWFNPDEFPPDEAHYAQADLILELNRMRNVLGVPIYPSPVRGALARNEGATSRHYAVGRLSDAIDFFVDAPPLHVFYTLLRKSKFGGIGVYFDTKYRSRPHIMFHGDLRDEHVLWLRHELPSGKTQYVTLKPGRPKTFWNVLARNFNLA